MSQELCLGSIKEFAISKDVVLPFMHKSGTPIKIKGHLAIIRCADGLPTGSAVVGSIDSFGHPLIANQ